MQPGSDDQEGDAANNNDDEDEDRDEDEDEDEEARRRSSFTTRLPPPFSHLVI
jgi:hypothetical protein